jgi:allophanate hydrolase subunit 2
MRDTKLEPSETAYRIVEAYGAHQLVSLPTDKRTYGVPPGGPFDRESAALANALAGRPADASLLEIALGPVTVEALEDTTLVLVGGPDGAFPLKKGERLKIQPTNARAYLTVGKGQERHLANPPRSGGDPIRILPGPQAPRLELAAFLKQSYKVGLSSNRVGLRLEGLAMPHAQSLPSEPAIPGAVQLPPSGHPIILGPDGPTIGGYPKIAVVIAADLDRLARLRPGDEIRFAEITLGEAHLTKALSLANLNLRLAELKVHI